MTVGADLGSSVPFSYTLVWQPPSVPSYRESTLAPSSIPGSRVGGGRVLLIGKAGTLYSYSHFPPAQVAVHGVLEVRGITSSPICGSSPIRLYKPDITGWVGAGVKCVRALHATADLSSSEVCSVLNALITRTVVRTVHEVHGLGDRPNDTSISSPTLSTATTSLIAGPRSKRRHNLLG